MYWLCSAIDSSPKNVIYMRIVTPSYTMIISKDENKLSVNSDFKGREILADRGDFLMLKHPNDNYFSKTFVGHIQEYLEMKKLPPNEIPAFTIQPEDIQKEGFEICSTTISEERGYPLKYTINLKPIGKIQGFTQSKAEFSLNDHLAAAVRSANKEKFAFVEVKFANGEHFQILTKDQKVVESRYSSAQSKSPEISYHNGDAYYWRSFLSPISKKMSLEEFVEWRETV